MMNPMLLEGLIGLGMKLVDTVLTKKKATDKMPVEKTKPAFDPNQTTIIEHTKAVAVHEFQERQFAPAKSLTVSAIGALLYVAMQSGYISMGSVQCMVDAAAEAEQAIEQKHVKQTETD